MTKGNILKPFTLHPSRGVKTNCEICDVRFQIIVKQQHQCKRCLRAICQRCGPSRLKIYKYDGTQANHRHCLVCIKSHEQIQSYKKRLKLCFGQDSEFVEEWIHKLTMNKEHANYEQIMNEYSERLCLTNENIIRFKREADCLFKQLQKSYNFSFRQFIGMMTEQISDIMFRSKVQNVTIAVYAQVKDMPYVPELIYLILFIMCFANEWHSYFIVTRIIQNLYPQYLRIYKLKKDNLLISELKIILEMYKLLAGKVQKLELQVVTRYLEARLTNFIQSFTLNVCSIEVSFVILEQMLKNRTYIDFYKGIATLVYICRGSIIEQQTEQDIEANMLKCVGLEELKSTMVRFHKSQIKFESDNEVFSSAEHRKLYDKFKQVQTLLQQTQDNLHQKQAKLKALLKEHELNKAKIIDLNKQVLELQEELVSYSDKAATIDSIDKLTGENALLLKRNTLLTDQCLRLRKAIEQIQKDKSVMDINYRMFERLEKSYTEEITKLKTKNEIYQIEKMAKEIDFNTSIIEQRLEAKNKQILELQERNKQCESLIQYYKRKTAEDSSNGNTTISNRSMIRNNTNLNISNITTQFKQKEDKDSFKKLIDVSKSMIANLKAQLQEGQNKIVQQEKTISLLKETCESQKVKCQQKQDIENVLSQVPEEQTYLSGIAELQRLVIKETNLVRKSSLESILSAFQKCVHECRYRTIDAKLKQTKLKSFSTNSSSDLLLAITNLTTAQESQRNSQNQLQDMISWLGSDHLDNMETVPVKKEECTMM